MESNLTFFSLPFVDSETSDLAFKGKGQEFDSDISNQLQLQGLTSDDVLAHFLTADGPLEEPDLNGPTTLHCEICAKQFDNAKKYYGHLRVHSKDNLWKCDKCPNQRFSTKQQLMKHSLVHKPLARVWKCPQCSLVFEALWRLQQHLFAKHLNYRPHKCEQCQKTFQKPSDLKKHLDTHSDERKHACPTCNVKFKDKSNLTRHLATHSSEKPFYCIGCGKKFKQVGSLNRHIKKCAFRGFIAESNLEKNAVKHYCNICGLAFQVKMSLIEHYVRQHTDNIETNKEQKQNQLNIDANKTVDNIVDDILSVEDEYMKMSTQKENQNTFNTATANQQDSNYDNLMHIEFFKDMNLYSLDDELLYNDIDLDTFQNSHMFNMNSNDIDYCMNDKNTEIQLDLIDVEKGVEQDIMSTLCQDKEDTLPDELLNVAEMTNFNKPSDHTDPLFSVNECATIFETDVDLEASTNLAANLNQLIGENSVQYISTEEDDTFIISLRSEIDAEQLTDMLNIDVGVDDTSKTVAEKPPKENSNPGLPKNIVPIIVELKDSIKPPARIENVPVIDKEEEKVKENKENLKKKPKKRVLFVCRTCCKVFNKKDNYRSHLGTHEPNLRRHGCKQCGLRFGYRSTLNKHIASKHASPDATPTLAHACKQCPKRYKAAWMLRAHVEREHERMAPHECPRADCGMRFYKRSDLAVHERSHTRERPYECDVCHKRYLYNSNLRRHQLTHVS